jgi:hypothetical protein
MISDLCANAASIFNPAITKNILTTQRIYKHAIGFEQDVQARTTFVLKR